MKILIADDDIHSLRLLELVLTKWGHEIFCANDGETAFETFLSKDIDVVITDWIMPNVNGLELCTKIREDKRDRKHYVYIILLTSQSGRDNLLKGMEAGADDYINKPLDKVELQIRLNVVERIMSYQHQIVRLEGLLPICCYCKKIRQEKNIWDEIEKYVSEHSFANFSHSICPGCYSKHVTPMLERAKKENREKKEKK